MKFKEFEVRRIKSFLGLGIAGEITQVFDVFNHKIYIWKTIRYKIYFGQFIAKGTIHFKKQLSDERLT